MLGWYGLRRRLRAVLTGVLVLFALLVVARLHACACTGGRPEWRPVPPATSE